MVPHEAHNLGIRVRLPSPQHDFTTMPAFLIGESLAFGWRKTKAHSRLLFSVLLTLFAVRIAYAIVDKVLAYTPQGVAAEIVLTVAGVVFGIGFTNIVLKLAKGEGAAYGDIVPPLQLAWQFLAASILVGVIVVVGLILLIVPGIYFLLRYSMVRFAALEGAGIRGSLRRSAQMTQNVKWRLLGFLLAIVGINILGALCFFVGLLVTVPMTMIAYARVYRKLQEAVEA